MILNNDKIKKDLYLTEIKKKLISPLILLILSFTISTSEAHCPALYSEEKVCLMLDGNLLYFYDHKLEHNGPYKDLSQGSIERILNSKKEELRFSKMARGIYKIDSKENLASLEVEIKNKKITQKITVKRE